MTVQQSKALRRLWERLSADGRGQWGAYAQPRQAYRAFRKSAFLAFGNVVMIRWCGMVIGIEPDGHTHS
jgi:hypothetical protein